MNKGLLQNKEVKEIAQTFAALWNSTKETLPNKFWDDFVKENTKPKEWEILTYKHPENDCIVCQKELDQYNKHYKLEHFIHSVKRLSDGEVFTVGDKIQFKYPFCSPMPTIIKSFEMANDLMVVRSSNISGDYTQDLSNIEKIKQSLFTTIDGKDIYEGDEFYIVVNWLSHSTIATQRHVAFKDGFSTREKAREYVLMNKPCLSVNDVMSFTFSETVHIKRLQEELTNLAKNKI